GTPTPLRLTVNVLEGEPTSLPCPLDLERQPVAAIWYRGREQVYALVEQRTPGSPTSALVDGTHSKKPSWQGRAFFSLLSDPPSLRLNRLERSDSGDYVCNVTYPNVTSGAQVASALRLFVAGEQNLLPEISSLQLVKSHFRDIFKE
ncbi:unnamed protein product, partial [Ixodes persulcatus]